ncbi:MAG: BrnT family toxin [candidate division WOR-3 bacterium]|nr:BrnT family toxin [candidate division WOR-3 bacterium]
MEKLEQKHRVKQHEVREVLTSRPRFRFVEKGFQRGEDVYSALGRTASGRYLIVFFVYKKDKRALILSARNMTDVERRKFEKK